jgi:hypothetical protein
MNASYRAGVVLLLPFATARVSADDIPCSGIGAALADSRHLHVPRDAFGNQPLRRAEGRSLSLRVVAPASGGGGQSASPWQGASAPRIVAAASLADLPHRQVEPNGILDDEKQREPEKVLPPSEVQRENNNAGCDAAVGNLKKAFAANRDSMGFPKDARYTFDDFITWYNQPATTEANRSAASAVVIAEQDYANKCLQQAIPAEMNADQVRRAVGMFMLGNEPFCTGLRIERDKVLTARHCFIAAESGDLSFEAKAFIGGTAQIWFVYEAEPNRRYGVCKSSLPSPDHSAYSPATDHVQIRVAPTTASLPDIRWSGTPLSGDTPLYLRGYFPFVLGAPSLLGHMSSTAVGGCHVQNAVDACFFHGCQSTAIMSGAPIFVRPETNQTRAYLELAGMHLGGATLSDPHYEGGAGCKGADGTMLLNKLNLAIQFK